jgi:hypothetical protein
MLDECLERLVFVKSRFANHGVNLSFDFSNKIFKTQTFLQSQFESRKRHSLRRPIHSQVNDASKLPSSRCGPNFGYNKLFNDIAAADNGVGQQESIFAGLKVGSTLVV